MNRSGPPAEQLLDDSRYDDLQVYGLALRWMRAATRSSSRRRSPGPCWWTVANLRRTAAAALLLAAVVAAGDEERFSFAADRMETVLAEGRERTLLTGNVTLIADDLEITAERIELYGKDLNFALSEGAVRVVQPEHGIELASESLLFDRQNRVVRIQGEALLIDHENEMVIKGGFLEHWERRDETLIQIGVRILSEDLVARAQFVRYDRGEQTVTLSGLPVVTWEGDEYRAARIFIDLDDDRIVLDGAVSGQLSTGTTETPTDAASSGVPQAGGGTQP